MAFVPRATTTTVTPPQSAGREMPAMRLKNERVELAMKIMKCRQLASRTADKEPLKRLEKQIAELEQKLREIDE
jgi:hypothetical protein